MLLCAFTAVMAIMLILSLRLYRYITQSGILLEGTWQSEGQSVKIKDNTAEIYRDGSAETAVLHISGYDDEIIKKGQITYLAELDYERRHTEITLILSIRGSGTLTFKGEDGDSEIFFRE